MNHNKVLKDILTEWNNLVYNIDTDAGHSIDLTNPYHMVKLEEAMISMELPDDFRTNFLSRMRGIKNNNFKIPKVVLNEGKREEASINTDMMETAALIGTTGVSKQPFIDLLDSPKVFKKIKIAKKDDIEDFKKQCNELIKLAKSAFVNLKKGLAKGGDWNSTGKSVIEGLKLPELIGEGRVPVFYENGLQTIAECSGLAWGMMEFVDAKVGFAPNFLHNKIQDFYATEKARGITRKGSKAATPDAILSNVSAGALLTALADSSNNVVGDASSGVVELGSKVKYIQVSLKKGVTDSQLGKFAKVLRGTYDLGVSNQEAIDILQEKEKVTIDEKFFADLIPESVGMDEVEMLIYEGFFSKIKDFATKTWIKLKSTFNNALNKIKSKFFTSKKISSSTVNKLIKGYNIKEWVDSDLELLNEAKMSDNTRATIKAIYNNPSTAYKNLATELSKVETNLKGLKEKADYIVDKLSSPKKIPKISGEKEPGATVVFSLINNIATFETISDLSKESKKLQSIVANLISEMLFGATKQPLFKVYGKMSAGDKAYSYVGTAETVQARIEEGDVNVELLGVNIHKNSNGRPYYNIDCYILNEITATNEKYYAKIRTGTNSSSHITFVFEGQQVLGPYPLNKDLMEVIV
tara:strand:- start:41 stop:1954 length:1914 start_codon:yes stop_codon:yes gene_type:complete